MRWDMALFWGKPTFLKRTNVPTYRCIYAHHSITSLNPFPLQPDQSQQFAHILRLLNTNVDGKRKIMYALTEIKGIGRRFSNVVCKKADVDLRKRAGELNSDELERIVTILQNPQDFKIPDWMLNRQRGGYCIRARCGVVQQMKIDMLIGRVGIGGIRVR